MTRRTSTGKRGGRPIGDTLGGILAGFDQQIMRNQPPPHELVQKGAPVRGLSGEDGGELVLLLPGEPATEPPADPPQPDEPAQG